MSSLRSFNYYVATNNQPQGLPQRHRVRPTNSSIAVGRCVLRVVFLDPVSRAHFVRALAPRAARPTPATGGARFTVTRAREEQDRGDEKGGPCAPAEAEGIFADGGRAAVGQEGVSGFDECRAVYPESAPGQCECVSKTYVINDTATV